LTATNCDLLFPKYTLVTFSSAARLPDSSEEIGMLISITGSPGRSQVKWAEHVMRIGADRLAMIAWVEKRQGYREIGNHD